MKKLLLIIPLLFFLSSCLEDERGLTQQQEELTDIDEIIEGLQNGENVTVTDYEPLIFTREIAIQNGYVKAWNVFENITNTYPDIFTPDRDIFYYGSFSITMYSFSTATPSDSTNLVASFLIKAPPPYTGVDQAVWKVINSGGYSEQVDNYLCNDFSFIGDELAEGLVSLSFTGYRFETTPN